MNLDLASTERLVPLVALAPAMLWGVLAYVYWTALLRWRPPVDYAWILPLISTLATVQISLEMVSELVRPELEGHLLFRAVVAPTLVTEVAVACLGRHLVLALSSGARVWQHGVRPVAIFAAGGLVAGSASLLLLLGTIAEKTAQLCGAAFAWGLMLLTAWQIRREIRGGRLEFSRLLNAAHRSDLVLVAFALTLYLSIGIVERTRFELGLVLEAAGDCLIAIPFALRASLSAVLRYLVLAASALATASAAFFGAQALATGTQSPLTSRVLALGVILALTLLLVGGRQIVDRLMLRLRRDDEEHRAFFRTLSPELGTVECCRRALEQIVGRPAVRGAALLLVDGSAVTCGDIDLDAVRPLWPTGAAAETLPARRFGVGWLRDAPLRDALIEANVASIAPLVSPRRRWGDIFISTGLTGMRIEEAEAIEAFGAQLALVLDAADLLARALGVERSLAHAEKLAAIGETAARIAHEIRNPITAARSLAQQLAREPGSPFVAEHEVILSELERVERQVAELLRFARREEFRLERVELGELVRAAVDRLRPRLDGAGIRVEVQAAGRLHARGDREKLGQVMINLIENAVDALARAPTEGRWIAVHLGAANGRATLRVADGGPGVPAEVLARLFEPFFTLKEHGTGLGLAIVKRTIEGHCGHIAVDRAPDAGLAFRIELPLVGQG